MASSSKGHCLTGQSYKEYKLQRNMQIQQELSAKYGTDNFIKGGISCLTY